MKASVIASKKGSNHALARASQTIRSDATEGSARLLHRCYYTSARLKGGRSYSSEASTAAAIPGQDGADSVMNGLKGLRALNGFAQQKVLDRGFFLDVLNSTASKREARSYLSRFDRPKEKANTTVFQKSVPPVRPGVNLGGLFPSPRAVDQNPAFSQTVRDEEPLSTVPDPLHVALVKINAPDTISDATISGVGLTLTKLFRLGMTPIVVVNHPGRNTSTKDDETISQWRKRAVHEADRVVEAIEQHNSQRARLLDSVIGVSPKAAGSSVSVAVQWKASVVEPNLLMDPIRRGMIPVLPALGYTQGLRLTRIPANEVMLALTRKLAGLRDVPKDEDSRDLSNKIASTEMAFSLDRIIILDPHGGIPSTEKPGGLHVFINLENDYPTVKEELSALSKFCDSSTCSIDSHLSNLELCQSALALLSPSSSALITTPILASNNFATSLPSTIGVSTRSRPNPLIHNILTDKPTFSSSLPSTRLAPLTLGLSQSQPPTFLKRGMPVTIYPDPRSTPWLPENPVISLSDPRIDLPRLVHLIEDSFSRKLDVQSYVKRLSKSLAGLIIAGSYEGCAILTWETPPLSHLPLSEIPSSRRVPYLDKFAVLKESQGAGGVADIVFNAMVSQCFPRGVVWRSRQDNPVNKWYFERAKAFRMLPPREGDAARWTMFWTTPGFNPEEFDDYVEVCRSVVPSWEDEKGAE